MQEEEKEEIIPPNSRLKCAKVYLWKNIRAVQFRVSPLLISFSHSV